MNMRRVIKRLIVVIAALLLVLVAGFVSVVGPWPVYEDSAYASQAYYAATVARIEGVAGESEVGVAPGRLQAGWAERDMTPPVGTPLAGYGGRPNEKRSMGVHDRVYARAIVLSDGTDTVALVGLDLLMTTINIAEQVWAQVGAETPLTQQDIFFTSSHTHCGAGGYMPGMVGETSAGAYDAAVVDLISGAIADAIISAYETMAPAELAHGVADAPEWIVNRTEVEGEDSSLRFLVLRKESGETCRAVRYSAHPTTLPESFLEVSAEYPGVLTRVLRERTGDMAVFLGGAVGAMGPVAPAGATDWERVEQMGTSLAERVLSYAAPLEFETEVDIASLSVGVDMPPMQARPWPDEWALSSKMRLSPWFAAVAGIPREGWIAAARVGDVFFLGLPYDTGGAIAVEWAAAAAEKGIDLWVSSHAIAYCGYLSPDEYYLDTPVGYDQWYEWRLMNWFGPNQEAMYADLKDVVMELLMPDSNANTEDRT